MTTSTVSTEDAAAVFAAAETQPGRQTNVGYRIQVSHDIFNYTVTINQKELSTIDSRDGMGGHEYVHVNATPEQDRALRLAHNMR
jgi:hypothetical protein